MLVKVSEGKSIFLDNISVKRLVKIVDSRDKFLGRSLRKLIKEHQELKLAETAKEEINNKSSKEIKRLVKDLKTAVICVEKSDKRLGEVLEAFLSDAIINMKLTKKQALEWDKWFYELK